MAILITKFNFPVYGIFILLSLVAGIIFNFYYLRKKKVSNNIILLSNFISISFCIIFSKYFTILTNSTKKLNLLNAGLSSYGAMIGIVIASFIFYKISKEKLVIKSNILVLPLMYSVSKLGCFFAGCCYGIPYNNIFSVIYTHGLNISLFPVQLVETITFFIIFIIGLKISDKKNGIYYLIVMCASAKFLLDYLRYSHISIFISVNQIISLIVIFITIIIIYRQKKMLN